MMCLRFLYGALLGFIVTVPLASAGETQKPSLALSDIMADPDWMGQFPERPYWADDGQSVYFEQKQHGSEQRNLFQLNLAQKTSEHLTEDRKWQADVSGGAYSSDRRLKLYSRQGDLYIKDLKIGDVR